MTEHNKWMLGTTARWFESQGRGPGEVSSGRDDHGGRSYGTYQLSSSAGTLADYIRKSSYGSSFKDMKVNSDAFIDTWKRLARDDPGFASDQHDYIKRTHYEPLANNLARADFDVNARGPAVQDMVWSTSVQYGGGRFGVSVVTRGLREAYGDKYVLDSLSDAQIVRAVQESKLRHVLKDFRGSLDSTPGIETRIQSEKMALVALAETGKAKTDVEIAYIYRDSSPLKLGSSGERVSELQENLADLGYFSKRGVAIDSDGHFGIATQEAVKAFQWSNGLYPHGEASALTRLRLYEQAVARDLGMAWLDEEQRDPPTCAIDGSVRDRTSHELGMLVGHARSHEEDAHDVARGKSAVYVEGQPVPSPLPPDSILRLNDPDHPDHAFFKQVREHVVALDKSMGRSPDQYTDNIASALTVQARADGLSSINEIALSADSQALWAIQTPPGRKDHLFDLSTKVPTAEATTPLEQSGARWPEAMQQFQSHEQERAQSQQMAIERSQATRQAQEGPSMSL